MKTIKEVFGGSSSEMVGQEVTVGGWCRSVRKSKGFSFLVLSDGSTQDTLQVVLDSSLKNYEEVSSLLTGACVLVKGKVVESQGKGQSLEMQAIEVEIHGTVSEDYPLQKKRTSLEFLREIPHLRCRSNTHGAVFRIRHHLSMAVHNFFNQEGFFYVHTPIITPSDCEGAGEMLRVTSLDLENPPKDKKGQVINEKDFFGKKSYLTVSGQLGAECMALGMSKVYTFGPTFRAENSHTARHLAEFWMIEPEVAFMDLEGNVQLAEQFLKYVINDVLNKCSSEFEFINQRIRPGIVESLKSVVDSGFKKVSYTDAVEILEKCVAEKKVSFEYPVKWGIDLQTEHERFLCEEYYQSPVVVTDYPKDIKAFYMKLNDDGKTVAAMDVLIPGVGEIIGGSQREHREDVLVKRMEEMDINPEEYWWYRDLRRYGGVYHSGFGLGFERLVMYVTGMSNIRDVIPFPRVPGNLDF